MIDLALYLSFVPLALALNLTPGADMMFCLAQGLRSGRRAALAANAGIATGAFIHVLLAGIGLGALVQSVPHAFDAIRWAGVAYLLWLAVNILRHPPGAGSLPPVRAARAFREGLMVNLTNPKVILFVLALLPQFTVPTLPLLPQFMILGATLSLGGLVVNGFVGVFAGTLGHRLATSPRFALWLPRISATLYSALAVRLALMSKSQ